MQEPMTSRARGSLLGEHRRLAHSPIPVQNNREAEVHYVLEGRKGAKCWTSLEIDPKWVRGATAGRGGREPASRQSPSPLRQRRGQAARRPQGPRVRDERSE